MRNMNNISNEADKSGVVTRLHELIRKMSKNEQQALLIELEKGFPKGKREHNRKFFHDTVDYTTESGTYRDFIKDISDGGVFIETRNPFSVGEEISMTFLLSEHKKRIKLQGEIVRIGEGGIGVKFKASQIQKEIIKSFVDKI